MVESELVPLFAQTMLVPADSAPGNWTRVDTWSTGSMTCEFLAGHVELEDRPDVSCTFCVLVGKSFKFSDYLNL